MASSKLPPRNSKDTSPDSTKNESDGPPSPKDTSPSTPTTSPSDKKPPKGEKPRPYEPSDPKKCAQRTYHLLGSLWGKADTGLKPMIEKFQRHAHLSDSVLAANGSTFPVAVQAHPVNTHYCRAREKHAVLYFYIGGTLLRLYAFAKKQSRENQDNFERWFARLRIVIRQWPRVVVYGSDPEGYRLLTEERAVQLLRNKDDADFKDEYKDED